MPQDLPVRGSNRDHDALLNLLKGLADPSSIDHQKQLVRWHLSDADQLERIKQSIVVILEATKLYELNTFQFLIVAATLSEMSKVEASRTTPANLQGSLPVLHAEIAELARTVADAFDDGIQRAMQG